MAKQNEQIVQPCAAKASWVGTVLSFFGMGAWWFRGEANEQNVDHAVPHLERKEEEQVPVPAKASWVGTVLSFFGMGAWWFGREPNVQNVDNAVPQAERKLEGDGGKAPASAPVQDPAPASASTQDLTNQYTMTIRLLTQLEQEVQSSDVKVRTSDDLVPQAEIIPLEEQIKNAIDAGEIDILRRINYNEWDIPKVIFSPYTTSSTKGPWSWTPLSYAVFRGQVEVVKFLVNEKQCSIYGPNDCRNMTWDPISLCLKDPTKYNVNQKMMEIFIEAGWEVKNNPDALISAIKNENEPMVDFLLHRGADPKTPNSCGELPLLVAAYWGAS